MANTLNKLSKNKPAEATAPPATAPAPVAEEKKKGGLIPRQKDPQKAAEEKALTEAITTALKNAPNGLTVDEIRNSVFDKVEDEELSATNKQIRSLCRGMHCTVTPVENSRKVRYSLPK